MRIRANSVLKNLSDDQLNQVYEWIASGDTYRDVQKRLSQPPPDGFGISVQLNTLWNFYASERRRRHAEQLAEARFNDVADPDPEQLLQNIKIELAHACYDLAQQPGAPTTVNALSRITDRLDRIKIDQQRAAIDQQRLALEHKYLAEKIRQFNFEAAKQAAIHALEIKETLQRNDIDLEDKVWKISEIVFGPKPNGDTAAAPPQ